MLLVALKLVGGLLGGPDTPLVLETERSIGGAPPGGADAPGGPAWEPGVSGLGGPPGGALARPRSGPEGGGGPPIGGGVEAAERGPPMSPFGGGGVLFFTFSSGPAFLFTQRFSSGS